MQKGKILNKLISLIFDNIKNIKINKVLFAFTLFMAFTGIISYFQIKSEISRIGKDFSESLTKEIVYSTNEWIKTRTEFIKTFSRSLSNLSKDQLLDIEIDRNRIFFQHYQIILDNASVIFDGEFYSVNIPLNTDKLSTCKNHEILKKTTIEICDDIGENRKFCGVIEASKIFPSIRKQIHSFVENAYMFDEDENIIATLNPTNEKPNFKDPKFTNIHKIGSWRIVISVSQKRVLEKTLKILLTNAIVLFVLFIILSLSAGFIYSLIKNTFLKKQKEYDVLLSHKLKISETGELLSAISHQLRQPINASLIMLTSILKLKQDGKLNDEELISDINLCIKSTKMMDSTIENFRNFYKFSDDISSFDLKSSIKNLLSLLHIDFSRKNISVAIDEFNITLKTSESYLWQVMLVLLQNSKDALLDRKDKKIINIKAFVEGEVVKISVIDNGVGIEDSMVKAIFNKQKISTKIHGSGIGLNLAKMIVVEKLKGELTLKNNKNPTIFELVIKKEI